MFEGRFFEDQLGETVVAQGGGRQGQRLAALAIHRGPEIPDVAVRGLGGDAGRLGARSDRDDRAPLFSQPHPAADLDEVRVESPQIQGAGAVPGFQPQECIPVLFPEVALVAVKQPAPPREHGAHVVEQMRPQAARGRGKAEAGPGGIPSVHAGDAVVPRAEVASHRLKADQRQRPVFGCAVDRDRLLQLVVLRGDQNVEVVGCGDARAMVAEPLRRRTLHEGGTCRVLDDEAPRFVVAEFRGQAAEQRAPLPRRSGRRVPACPMAGDRPELCQEGVPSVALMRAEGRECAYPVFGQGLVHFRQRQGFDRSVDRTDPEQGIGQ